MRPIHESPGERALEEELPPSAPPVAGPGDDPAVVHDLDAGAVAVLLDEVGLDELDQGHPHVPQRAALIPVSPTRTPLNQRLCHLELETVWLMTPSRVPARA